MSKKIKLANTDQDLFITNEYGVSYIEYEDIRPSPALIKQYKKDYNIRTDVADACVSCQIAQIAKYLPTTLPGENPWQISCSFIPKSYDPPKHILAQITKDQAAIYRATQDPVFFAKYFLGWEARKQQRIALRCTSKKSVQRWGRRSGKSEEMALKIIFQAITEQHNKGVDGKGNPITSGPTIMMVTPYLNQITNMFDKIQSLLHRSTEIQALMTRFVKTPHHRMEFSNGAAILGFTTGSSSGSESATIRGQGANHIYFDESDFMNESDYKAIIPILHESDDHTIEASSTPKGTREKFYQWCKTSPDWKEFHFPSTVLDNWDDVKKSVEAEHSKAEIMQEYMAEFLAQDVGVYQPQYIAYAASNPRFSYMDMMFNASIIYSIGVDWNSNVGTELCVIGCDKAGHMWLVETVNVPKQDWTQLAAIEKLLDLNKKWKPKYIYVDSGYGATNVEIIKSFSVSVRGVSGHEDDARIIDILKAYEFGGKLAVRDPVTGQVIKKPAKDFMIQNSVRRFEDRKIHIPIEEEILKKQLHNYIIKNINIHGQRIYGQENSSIGDHRLDAFNLALVAFKLEMSDFAVGGLNVVTTVLYAGIPGENRTTEQQKKVMPFAADIKYPDGYMEYNIKGRPHERHRPTGRSLDTKTETSMFGKGIIQPEKPVYPGSVMKEARPGFANDTEHKHVKHTRPRRIATRPGNFRRNI